MVVRAARAPDQSALLALLAQAKLEAHFMVSEFLVVERDGQVVACGRLKRLPEGAQELASIAVAPALQRQGLGDELTRKLLERADGPVYALALASSFFARYGFVPTAQENLPASLWEKANGMCASTGFVAMQRAKPFTVLFACVGNSARSQMAEGFAKHLGAGTLVARSGGSKPLGYVLPNAIAVMREKGIDISKHPSERFNEAWVRDQCDLVVTMGCGDDACPAFVGKRIVDWDLEDPKGKDIATFRRIRDEIEQRVKALVANL